MNNSEAIQFVTEQITNLLDKGQIPWEIPWAMVGEGCWSRATAKNYSLLNTLLIAAQYMERHEKAKKLDEIFAEIKGEYLTFNQIKELGGSINKGAKSYKIIFFKWIDKEMDEKDDNGEAVIKHFPILRLYNVFRLADCNGVKQKHFTKDIAFAFTQDTTAEAIVDEYLKRSGVVLKHERQNKAFYSPATDTIVMPERIQFKATDDYYSTLFHEMTHSTGHSSRLNRITTDAAFDLSDYSVEELTAEIGSAAILCLAGLKKERTIEQSAAYCQSWLEALKNDKRMIIVASARAEKAVQLILGN